MDHELLTAFAQLTLAESSPVDICSYKDTRNGRPVNTALTATASAKASNSLQDASFGGRHTGAMSSALPASQRHQSQPHLTERLQLTFTVTIAEHGSRAVCRNQTQELDRKAASEKHNRTLDRAADKTMGSPSVARVGSHHPTTSSARIPTTFLSLPTEVRLVIYDMLFACVLDDIVLSRSDCFPLPPLLRTSRLLRAEAFDSWRTQIESAVTNNDEFRGFVEAQRIELEKISSWGWLHRFGMEKINKVKRCAAQHHRHLRTLKSLTAWYHESLFGGPHVYVKYFGESKKWFQELYESGGSDSAADGRTKISKKRKLVQVDDVSSGHMHRPSKRPNTLDCFATMQIFMDKVRKVRAREHGGDSDLVI